MSAPSITPPTTTTVVGHNPALTETATLYSDSTVRYSDANTRYDGKTPVPSPRLTAPTPPTLTPP